MEVDEKLLKELNDQFTRERYSSELYSALSSYFDYLGLLGFSSYFGKKADEERVHSQKFKEFIQDLGYMPVFASVKEVVIPNPSMDKAPLELMQASYEHEQFITSNIHNIYSTATTSGNCAVVAFILPFATEQVEEEKTVQDWVNKLDLADGNTAAILLMDSEIGG